MPISNRSTIATFFLGALLSASALAGPVTLQNATATFSQTCCGIFPVGQSIDGSFDASTGWAIYRGSSATSETAVFETAADIGISGNTLFTFTLHQLFTSNNFHTLGKFRISLTTDDRATFADGLSTGGDVTATWAILTPLTAVANNGPTLTIQGDGSVLASGTAPATTVYTVTAMTSLTGVTGVRLEDGSLPDSGPGRFSNGNFVLSEFTVDAESQLPEPSTFGLAFAGVGLALFARKRARVS